MAIYLSREACRLYRLLFDLAKIVDKELRVSINLVETARQYASGQNTTRNIIDELFARKLIKLVDDACGKPGNKTEVVLPKALNRLCTYEIDPQPVKEVKKMGKVRGDRIVEKVDVKGINLLWALKKLPTRADGSLIFPPGGLYQFVRDNKVEVKFSDNTVIRVVSKWLKDNGYLRIEGKGTKRQYFLYQHEPTLAPVPETIVVPVTDEEIIEQLEVKLAGLEKKREQIIEAIAFLRQDPIVRDTIRELLFEE